MAKLLSFVKVNCEWDIGQEGALFSTVDAAREWAVEACSGCGIEDPIDELEDAGLVNYEFWEVVA